MKRTGSGGAKLVLGIVGLLAAVGVAAYFLGPWFSREKTTGPAKEAVETPAELVRDARGEPLQPPTLRLSARTAKALGINSTTIVTVAAPKHVRALPPQTGTLGYDNDRLFAVRSRFAGEVNQILNCPPSQRGSFPELPNQLWPKSEESVPTREKDRPFTVGDQVKKGQLLAVVWSRDLADKKAALIDAMIDLRRDSARLEDLEVLYYKGSVSRATFYEAQRTVQKDISTRNAAERILRVWGLDDKEINDLKKEAETIDVDRRDSKKEAKEWARLEVRAPEAGVIVEKNTHLGDWVDPSNYTTPMFRIADLSKLQVWLSPAEEYVPALQDYLKKPGATPLTWDIALQADPKAPHLTGTLVRLAPSLDYTQHTPLLVGVVDNPNGRLLVGQFVTATIFVPLEDNLVEIPTTALNEERGQSVVFVQRDPQKLEFTLQAVEVVHRFKDVVYVRSQLAKGAQLPGALPVLALHPGDRVITESVVELTKALRDLLAKDELAKKQEQK
jgi:cobalt-zinc-cadmium efflux system membrane fusion protein